MKLSHLSKQELRKSLKFARSRIVKKSDKDSAIIKTLIDSSLYKESKQILLYMALDDEVNIDSLVDLARINGKSVAVPFCTNSDGHMEFYYINTLNDLKVGNFGVREPKIDICKKMTDYSNSIIIVPAIAFDTKGYRLGYGKGYYDRFLTKYPLISIGLCYNSLVVDELPTDEYDKSVDYIITDTRFLNIRNGENNG